MSKGLYGEINRGNEPLQLTSKHEVLEFFIETYNTAINVTKEQHEKTIWTTLV